MASLSREVLRWIQSLDLSYSVKNVKRDFSNGFLVAEIFSRFYVQDIQMHSFDNGISLERKLNNWKLLEKFFTKKNIPITWKDDIEPVVHNKPNAAVRLVQKVYEMLTNRKIVVVPPKVEEDIPLPAFTQPTAASVLKMEIADSEMTLHKDVGFGAAKTQDILTDHYQRLQLEKQKDPQRYAPRSGSSTRSGHSTSMRKEIRDGTAQIQFKEVKVKKVDRGVASQLRGGGGGAGAGIGTAGGSSRGAPSSASSQMDGFHAPPHEARLRDDVSGSPVVDDSGNMRMLPVSSVSAASILVKLNSIVEEAMKRTGYIKVLDPEKDFAVSFMEIAVQLPDEVVQGVFSAFTSKRLEIMDIVVASPTEFWKFFSTLCAGLSFSPTSTAYMMTVSVLADIGKTIVQKYKGLGWTLLDEFGLLRMKDVLFHNRVKRKDVLRIIYSYAEETVESHIVVIRTLQEYHERTEDLVMCLSDLVAYETEFTEELADLYLYYAIIGMGMSNPSARACSLAILVVLAANAHGMVMEIIDRVEALVTDTWWEVRAQLIILLATLLRGMPSPATMQAMDGADGSAEKVLRLLESISTGSKFPLSPVLQKVLLSSIAPLAKDHPTLCTRFVLWMLETNDAVRLGLLSAHPDDHAIQLLTPPSSRIELRGVMDLWHPLSVVMKLSQIAEDQKWENFEREPLQILQAAVQHPFASHELVEWGKAYDALRYFLFAGLCDEELCSVSAEVLTVFFEQLGTHVLSSFGTMMGSIKLIGTQGTDEVQVVLNQFLVAVYQMGEPFVEPLRDLATKLPQEVRRSQNLAQFVDLALH